jgi:hypothetical protein
MHPRRFLPAALALTLVSHAPAARARVGERLALELQTQRGKKTIKTIEDKYRDRNRQQAAFDKAQRRLDQAEAEQKQRELYDASQALRESVRTVKKTLKLGGPNKKIVLFEEPLKEREVEGTWAPDAAGWIGEHTVTGTRKLVADKDATYVITETQDHYRGEPPEKPKLDVEVVTFPLFARIGRRSPAELKVFRKLTAEGIRKKTLEWMRAEAPQQP